MLFSFFQDIYNYMLERIHVPTVYHVAAVLSLQFMVHVIIIIIYFCFYFLIFLCAIHIFLLFIIFYLYQKMHIYIYIYIYITILNYIKTLCISLDKYLLHLR